MKIWIFYACCFVLLACWWRYMQYASCSVMFRLMVFWLRTPGDYRNQCLIYHELYFGNYNEIPIKLIKCTTRRCTRIVAAEIVIHAPINPQHANTTKRRSIFMIGLTHFCLVMPSGVTELVNFVSGDGFLPDGTKPLPVPIFDLIIISYPFNSIRYVFFDFSKPVNLVTHTDVRTYMYDHQRLV